MIKRVWRCTCRPLSSEFGDANGGRDRVTLDMHLEAAMERVWRCTGRLWSTEFGDAVGGRDGANLEAVLSAYRDTLGGYDWACLEMHLQAMIERDWRGGIQSGGGSSEARRYGSGDSIHWLTCNCANPANWAQHGLPTDEGLAGSARQSIFGWCSMRCMQYSVYAVLGECCTRCMVYSVYAVLGVNPWSWHGEIERDDLTSCS